MWLWLPMGMEMDLNRSVYRCQISFYQRHHHHFQGTKLSSQKLRPHHLQHCNHFHQGRHRVKRIYNQQVVTKVNEWIICSKKTKTTKWARRKLPTKMKIFQSRTWIKLVVTVVELLTFAMPFGMRLASKRLKFILIEFFLFKS